MRLTEIFREAYRNSVAGTARTISLCLTLAILVGSAALLHSREVVSLSQQAEAFQLAGASTFVIELSRGVKASTCEVLDRSDGVVASGAVSDGGSQRLVVWPGRNLPVWNVTPGMAGVLGVKPLDMQGPQVWISKDVADDLGVKQGEFIDFMPGDSSTDEVRARVTAVFDYPDDGRDQRFAGSLLIPVAANFVADSCFADVWPNPEIAVPLLNLTVERSDMAQQAKTAQFNYRLGAEWKAPMRWNLALTGVALLSGLLAPLVALRTRRIEFASSLHAGVQPISLVLMLLAEWLFWALPAVLLASAGILVASISGNPDPPLPAILAGLTTLAAGVAGSLCGMVIAGVSVKEKHLFGLFNSR